MIREDTQEDFAQRVVTILHEDKGMPGRIISFVAVVVFLSCPDLVQAAEQKPALLVSGWSVTPFILLLLGIAVLPLLAPRFWHSNRNRAVFTTVLSLPTVLYLLFLGGPATTEMLYVLREYADFILLLALNGHPSGVN